MTRTDLRKLGAGLVFISSIGEFISVAAQTPEVFRLATERVALLGLHRRLELALPRTEAGEDRRPRFWPPQSLSAALPFRLNGLRLNSFFSPLALAVISLSFTACRTEKGAPGPPFSGSAKARP
jgi:hypothetical protein